MALSLNSVTLAGHLTRDPGLRQLPDGRDVCDIRLAANGLRDQPPVYIDVATFGRPATACARYLRKGAAVGVTGRLTYNEWIAKDGSKRSKHSVVGRMQFGARQHSAEDLPAEEALAAAAEARHIADEDIPF
jgi:single-strand DNA-binding protein